MKRFFLLPLGLAALASAVPAAAQTRPALSDASCTSTRATGIADALLGGRPSQLDLLRRQQVPAAPVTMASAEAPQPAASAAATGGCARLALPAVGGFNPGRREAPLGGDAFLASRRLPVARTVLDAQWNRVRSEALPASSATAFAGLSAGANGERLLTAVNTYANHRIRYVEDRVLYGRPDYWASAGATLARGAGDCEDIAIAKLQLLAAAGVPRSDMFLTIARDLVRNADHAVLVVRVAGRFWLLDNSSDRVVDAAPSYDYRPIMSFSEDHRWLHGY